MQLKQLVKHFDDYERLPIPVRFIKEQLVENGVQDEIRFHFVDINPLILRGLIYRYTKHGAAYQHPVFCSEPDSKVIH